LVSCCLSGGWDLCAPVPGPPTKKNKPRRRSGEDYRGGGGGGGGGGILSKMILTDFGEFPA